MTKTEGTKEWAGSNVNIQKGCSNGCTYCYAMVMARRFGRAVTYDQWRNPIIDTEKVQKGYKKRSKRIMFPSSHDITPSNLGVCITVLEKMLKPGNEVLIVSKPRLGCIKRICERLKNYKRKILFRFTITHRWDHLRNEYEPHAPFFIERLDALKYAYKEGFQTSVSIEPYLEDPLAIITMVQAFVTDTIWLGVMSGAKPKKLKLIYKREYILKRLPAWKEAGNGKLRLKDSITNMEIQL